MDRAKFEETLNKIIEATRDQPIPEHIQKIKERKVAEEGSDPGKWMRMGY